MSVKKYRNRPLPIDAIQYRYDNVMAVMDWVEKYVNHNSEIMRYDSEKNRYWFRSPACGEVALNPTDYLVYDFGKIQLYTLKEFEELFEEVR